MFLLMEDNSLKADRANTLSNMVPMIGDNRTTAPTKADNIHQENVRVCISLTKLEGLIFFQNQNSSVAKHKITKTNRRVVMSLLFSRSNKFIFARHCLIPFFKKIIGVVIIFKSFSFLFKKFNINHSVI